MHLSWAEISWLTLDFSLQLFWLELVLLLLLLWLWERGWEFGVPRDHTGLLWLLQGDIVVRKCLMSFFFWQLEAGFELRPGL